MGPSPLSLIIVPTLQRGNVGLGEFGSGPVSSIKFAFINPVQVSLFCPLDIFSDLLSTDFVHRIAGWRHVEDFIPLRRHTQTFVNREDAVPVETGVGLVAIQFEKLRLVKGLRVGEVFP